ncbi:hypothetical protein GCM10011613_15830 [Cellvibrio zantedeschiae]|uniref:CcoQ/FixQ family Cbb3-type cytochrome c oxidase assembly chaperone n=1 Tax=Cellvibrio zantedeschiae TaxID=1237077 RepID=A0ABQ3B1G9_9GAMM|nr:hypothetical protein [Cellvibrio zantedeschiae]GGY71785.1 hypothetical protein GCM10011613_15830 [Cellvibrio zantedeschiae]
MNWITEHSAWILFALILFTAIWFIAFSARNQQAKTDQGSGLHSDEKPSGVVPLKKSDKL